MACQRRAQRQNNNHNQKLDGVIKAYFRELADHPPVTRDEERDLLRRVKNGDQRAMRELIMANLRFVVAVAKKYQHINDVPFEELIAEGNLGLLRAAQRFEDSFNVRFISYAVWWIRQAIVQVLSRYSHPVQLPLHRVHQLLKIRRVEEELGKKLNRRPSLFELADALKIQPARLHRFLESIPRATSLENPIDGDEDLELKDVLSDEGAADPSLACEMSVRSEEIQRALNTLKPREQLVLAHRFGLLTGRPETLEEIGKLMNLSRERVRQIEAEALDRLRHPVRSTRLLGFRD